MSEDLKISIVVPIYNVEQYLRDCVKSLIIQTYKNIEILLVNDGSTDNSGVICDQLKEEDGRIFVFHKENGRTASARNLGVKNASGQYVMFIDPDDWLEQVAIEELVKEIERSKVDVVRFNYVKEYGSYAQKNQNSLITEKSYRGEDYCQIVRKNLGLIGNELKNIESFNFLASVCFACYKRNIILENGLEFTDIDKIGSFSDGLFNLQYLMKAKSFAYIDQYFYHYRKNNNNAYTSRNKKNFLEKNLVLFEEIKKLFKENELGKDFENAYFNRIAYCVLELNLNVMKNHKVKFKECYTQIKTKLKNELIKEAIKRFKLAYLPLKWKIYYLFVKSRYTLSVCMVTKIILRLRKGRLG